MGGRERGGGDERNGNNRMEKVIFTAIRGPRRGSFVTSTAIVIDESCYAAA